MEAGPSKEQLESLYKTSRKYFDELAKEYYTKDRDFYNKNFAPFYNNPLLAAKRRQTCTISSSNEHYNTLYRSSSFYFVLLFIQKKYDNKPVKQSEKYEPALNYDEDKPASSVKDSIDKENIQLNNMDKVIHKRKYRKKRSQRQTYRKAKIISCKILKR